MIRLFTALCKAFLKQNESDEKLFLKAVTDFNYYDASCPECGAFGKLVPHGDYTRTLLSFENGSPVDQYVKPPRFLCESCETTHALLPDIIVPFSPYSLRFKLAVLTAYFERKMSVKAICEYFVIAVSTLYEWSKRLPVDKDLMLGALISRKTPALAFLNDLLESVSLSDRLCDFYRKHAVSFLQLKSMPAARSRPP